MAGTQPPADEPTPLGPARDRDESPGLVKVIVVLLAVLFLAGGGAAAVVILTSDGENDGDNASQVVSLADWCDSMKRIAESDDELSDDPHHAAELLRGAGVPADLPVEAGRGRDLVIEIADGSTDGDEAEEAFANLAEADLSDANAFFAFYSESCLETQDEPPGE